MEKKKTFGQVFKFILVSGGVGIIQLILANLLPVFFDQVVTPVPVFLQGIFNPDVLFDCSTVRGALDYAKYVVDGVVTWGYVLPFLLSNLLANIYGYFQNRRTTFNSDSSVWNVWIYLVVLVALIFITTWLQSVLVGKMQSSGIGWLSMMARTIAALATGFLQAVVLFPLEKFVLMK